MVSPMTSDLGLLVGSSGIILFFPRFPQHY